MFLRVEFRMIGRKIHELDDAGISDEPVFYQFTFVPTGIIPDEKNFLFGYCLRHPIALDDFEEQNCLRSVLPVTEMGEHLLEAERQTAVDTNVIPCVSFHRNNRRIASLTPPTGGIRLLLHLAFVRYHHIEIPPFFSFLEKRFLK